MPIRIILVGPPGVGKGTQSSLLQEKFGPVPLSSGMIFRAEIDAQTDLGELAKSYIDRGELVPNGVTIQMMLKRIRTAEVQQKGFILDGFPRSLRQAEALDEALANAHTPIDKVFSLVVNPDLIIERLSGRMGCTKCGEIYHAQNKPPKREGFCDKCNGPVIVRQDDQPDTIRERLKVFHKTTAPVIDHYKVQNKVISIDGSLDPQLVFQQIVQNLTQ